jgi:GNAT superfamily N-acetyltransferase
MTDKQEAELMLERFYAEFRKLGYKREQLPGDDGEKGMFIKSKAARIGFAMFGYVTTQGGLWIPDVLLVKVIYLTRGHRGKGLARKVMKDITTVADKQGLTLAATVRPFELVSNREVFSDDSDDKQKIIKLVESAGFVSMPCPAYLPTMSDRSKVAYFERTPGTLGV